MARPHHLRGGRKRPDEGLRDQRVGLNLTAPEMVRLQMEADRRRKSPAETAREIVLAAIPSPTPEELSAALASYGGRDE